MTEPVPIAPAPAPPPSVPLLTTTADQGDAITVWDEPSAKLRSQYGYTNYREWCEFEVLRIGFHKAHVGRRQGKIAVVRMDLGKA